MPRITWEELWRMCENWGGQTRMDIYTRLFYKKYEAEIKQKLRII